MPVGRKGATLRTLRNPRDARSCPEWWLIAGKEELLRGRHVGLTGLKESCVSETSSRRCHTGGMDLLRTGTMSSDERVSDAEVYRRHARELVRFATVLVGPDDAQDVVANAFVRCLASKRWRDMENPRAYLFRVVANEARNLRRSEARRRVREESVPADPAMALPSFHPEVVEAIRRLSVRQRSVVYLAYWEDMTDRMIGEYLGIGAGSVRRHLGRARAKLREVLDA